MSDPDRTRHLAIEGSAIRDIPSFYDEINRVFMADEDWRLGPSLDALNDMLYGGYGALMGADAAFITWHDIEMSRAALGIETTLRFLRARAAERSQFNGSPIAGQIAALEGLGGTTYFDVVMEIFADHPNIALIHA